MVVAIGNKALILAILHQALTHFVSCLSEIPNEITYQDFIDFSEYETHFKEQSDHVNSRIEDADKTSKT
ncbi:MAG: hypothetical protein MHMPM18_000194 [Marteilia pararefringens]